MYFSQNFLAALILSSLLVFAGCSTPAVDSRPQPKPAALSEGNLLSRRINHTRLHRSRP